ncbi:MAG: NAD-dependent epimerase/dehydratase family protein [Longimicrobiales bacterium]
MKRGKLLLTGYPGFLGSHLYQELEGKFELFTLGLDEAPTPNHTVADLSESIPALRNEHYDLVIHAAGKAHSVPSTAEERDHFFQVNEQGTLNLLAALDELTVAPGAIALISTVAVYGRESGHQITESHPLEATDPYGVSKINAEKSIREWEAAGVVKAIVRLPLIIGKQPPGNLGTMIRSIKKGFYFNVDGGRAKRSFVWIDDIAPFVVRLVAEGGGTYNLTDGHDASFKDLYSAFCRALGKRPYPALPRALAVPLALTGDSLERLTGRKMPFNRHTLIKMTSDLTFSCQKAKDDLAWTPTVIIDRLGEVVGPISKNLDLREETT